jgi:hypothetical protein
MVGAVRGGRGMMEREDKEIEVGFIALLCSFSDAKTYVPTYHLG